MNTFKYYENDQLPIFLDAKAIAGILGISKTSVYHLMREDDFPSLRIGRRVVVHRDKFLDWVNKKSEEG